MLSGWRWVQAGTGLLIVALLSLLLATEYVAWRLGFQAALGPPLFLFGDRLALPVYPPWALVNWWWLWGQQQPLFSSGLWLAAGFMGVCLAGPAGRQLQNWHRHQHKREFGKRAYGRAADARRAGIFSREVSGTVLGQWPDGRLLSYAGDEHQLVAGAAGSGKTAGPVISSLLAWPGAALVYDPKRELYAQTAAYRARLGGAFYFDPACPDSACFNPLAEIRVGTTHETADIQNLVAILIDPAGAKAAPDYWDSAAAQLLTGLVLFALYDLPPERQTLAELSALLLAVQRTLPCMSQSRHPRCRLLADYFRSLPERQLAGVYGAASAALTLYDDPLVAEKTSRSDFRLADLVCSAEPLTCYLQVRPSDALRLRPLTRLILTQTAQALMHEPDTAADGRRKRHRLLYLLEEFPSLGRLEFFSAQMRQMRGYGITGLLVVQSFKDLVQTYGPAQTIADNCRIIVCFAAADPDTLRAISTQLGTAEERKESETRPQGRGAGRRSVSISEQRRPLLEPGEVRRLGPEEQLVLVTGAKPFRTRKVRWYRHPLLRQLGTDLRQGGVAPPQPAELLARARQAAAGQAGASARSAADSFRGGADSGGSGILSVGANDTVTPAWHQPAATGGDPAAAALPALAEAPASGLAAAASTDREAVPANLPALIAWIGWTPSEAARRLFPQVPASTARKWTSGSEGRVPPPAHQPFVTALLALADGFSGTAAELSACLTPDVLERLRQGEAAAREEWAGEGAAPLP